ALLSFWICPSVPISPTKIQIPDFRGSVLRISCSDCLRRSWTSCARNTGKVLTAKMTDLFHLEFPIRIWYSDNSRPGHGGCNFTYVPGSSRRKRAESRLYAVTRIT